jgi:hypothetical protein
MRVIVVPSASFIKGDGGGVDACLRATDSDLM